MSDTTTIERRRCRECGKPHQCRTPGQMMTWADPDDGHPFYPEPWEELVERLTAERDALQAALESVIYNTNAPTHDRYVVLCDDGSVLITDELMDGDNVVLDRGALGEGEARG